jgi:hypothetical protein
MTAAELTPPDAGALADGCAPVGEGAAGPLGVAERGAEAPGEAPPQPASATAPAVTAPITIARERLTTIPSPAPTAANAPWKSRSRAPRWPIATRRYQAHVTEPPTGAARVGKLPSGHNLAGQTERTYLRWVLAVVCWP